MTLTRTFTETTWPSGGARACDRRGLPGTGVAGRLRRTARQAVARHALRLRPRLRGRRAPSASTSHAALPPIALADIDASAAAGGRALLTGWAMPTPTSCGPTASRAGAVPPTQLVRQRLRDALARAAHRARPGRERQHRAHRRPHARHAARLAGRVQPLLRIAGASVGLVRVRATLVRGSPAGERVLGQRFTVRRPAPSADAAGGVKALAAASDAAVAEIVAWVDQPR